MIKVDTILEASTVLLGETCQLLNSIGTRYLIVGGWSPFLLNQSKIVHPGTRDVGLGDVIDYEDKLCYFFFHTLNYGGKYWPRQARLVKGHPIILMSNKKQRNILFFNIKGLRNLSVFG